ncbi:hypothetical protein [Acidiferrobacter sp.]|uniref:hypothetical protein n=1 Tax=Acidiferrobacter sp. TaxID=1872107 RepID=UPI002639324B|nr:hypothetical protein [Acidiferrobacter sp.]
MAGTKTRARAATIPWAQERIAWRSSQKIGKRCGPDAVMFPGRNVVITMIANAPHHPDMSFETGGLTNPTVCVTQGAHVTLEFSNMDYGPGMAHGLVITSAKPPYPLRISRHLPAVLARINALAPRSNARLNAARYAEATVHFVAGRAGTYYYICPIPGHALAFHMYGRFIVRPLRSRS